MNELTRMLISFALYPGLITLLVLSLGVALIARLHAPGGGLSRGIGAALRGAVPPLLLATTVLPLLIGGVLPWPAAPLAPGWALADLWLVWAVLEACFLGALLPGLRSRSPYAVRAALREAQLGGAGRVVLWSAIGVSVWAGTWQAPTLAAHVLALGAALLALPVAAGWGPFAPETSVTPGGAEASLSRAALELAQWGRVIRATLLLVLIAVLMLPRPERVHPALNVAIIVAAVGLLALLGRLLNGNTVRRSLLDGLSWCWWRAAPLVGLAALALWAGQRWL